jgi:hypothetical protein
VLIFFIFWSSKICISPTRVVYSFFPFRCHLSSDRCSHAVTTCLTSFTLSQDELAAFTSFSGNALFRRFSSRAKNEALNLHHHRMLSSSDRLTPTLHYYKKDHLNLVYSLHHSTVSLFCFLHRQSTIPSELHPSPSFSLTAVSRISSLYIMTPTIMK